MSRKHFREVAEAIRINVELARDNFEPSGEAMCKDIALSLCVTFRGLNPNFNRAIFMEACGF